MFGEDIHRYDLLAKEYVRQVVEPMGKAGFQKYSEIMLSCHSCGIEGSSFSVDDTRALFEEGPGLPARGQIAAGMSGNGRPFCRLRVDAQPA